MNKGRGIGIVWAALSALAVTTSAIGDAGACGGDWFPELEVDYRPMGVAMAEKLLEEGKSEAAAATIVRVMPHVAQLDPNKSTLTLRAQRVLGVALARSAGTPAIAREVPDYAISHWAGDTEADREANLTFAVQALRSVSEIKTDDPAVQTELAEALAQVEGGRTEAREILEGLAEKDLIATPEGYAALAALRSAAGDESGKKIALTRCEAMAPDASVCRATAQG